MKECASKMPGQVQVEFGDMEISHENVLSFSCWASLLQEFHKNSNANTFSKWSGKLPTAIEKSL